MIGAARDELNVVGIVEALQWRHREILAGFTQSLEIADITKRCLRHPANPHQNNSCNKRQAAGCLGGY
jgi:hypothetical protein